MRHDAQESKEALTKLIAGMAEYDFVDGHLVPRAQPFFFYDGARLYPEDVADMLLPSILCLAQGVSRYVGMGEFGYEYTLDAEPQEAFPLAASPVGEIAPFHRIAPHVVEAFDSYVLENRADIARVFEAAAQMIYPDFTLERNTRTGREAMAVTSHQQGPKV